MLYLDDTNNRVGVNSESPTVALDVIGNIKLNGNLVTAGNSGDDIDFDLGTAAGGGQIIDEKAIADDGGSAVTITANTPLYIIENGLPAVANKFANMNGGPATSEAMTLAASLYSSAARTLHIRLKPLATNLATAATTVTFIVEFQHLGVTPS